MKQSNLIRKEGAVPEIGGKGAALRVTAHAEQAQKIKTPLYAALGLLVVVDFFVHREHAAFIWDSVPGFSTLFGLIATALIIFVSKFIGLGLTRPENYYGGRHD